MMVWFCLCCNVDSFVPQAAVWGLGEATFVSFHQVTFTKTSSAMNMLAHNALVYEGVHSSIAREVHRVLYPTMLYHC